MDATFATWLRADELSVRAELSASDKTLRAGLHIAQLDANGSVLVPPTTSFGLLEIGCSDRDLLVEQLDGRPYRDGGFLLSIEPLLDKYAAIVNRIARGGPRDRGFRLGYYHPRAVALPLAVSPHGREATLTVHRVAGCSSLLALNPSSNHSRLCHTSGELERRRVPTITLQRAIALLPSRLPIRLLKLDAQGMDVPLLKTVPPSILRDRVERIEFESIGRRCAPLYIGQPSCDEAGRYLQAIGFRATPTPRGDPCHVMTSNPYERRTSLYGYGCEATLRYDNVRLVLLANLTS